MRPPRRALEAALVLAGLASVTWWYLRQQAAPSQLRPLALTGALAPGEREEWFGIYLDQQKVGYSGTRLTPRPDSGQRFTTESLLRVATATVIQTIRMQGASELDPQGMLERFSLTYEAGPAGARISGTVRGTTAVVSIASPSGEQQLTLTLAEPPVFPVRLREQIARQATVAGQSYTATIFDPLSLAGRSTQTVVRSIGPLVTPDGSTWQAVHLEEQVPHLNLSSDVWVDRATGWTIKEVSPLGFVSLREPRERAVADISDAPLDLLGAMSVRPEARHLAALGRAGRGLTLDPQAPPDQAPLGQLVLRLDQQALSAPGLDLAGGRQRLHDSLLTITLEERGRFARVPWPVTPRPVHLERELSAEPLLQADDPRLRAAAATALGDPPPPNALEAVRRLARFVDRHVEEELVAALPSALDVLERGRGDCTEHTALLVALCRSVGIPARPVAGLAFMGSGGLEPAFYYHAWVEVHLGDWLTVDPTWGQLPADVTHIRLVSGGLIEQAALIGLMGRLRLQLIEAL